MPVTFIGPACLYLLYLHCSLKALNLGQEEEKEFIATLSKRGLVSSTATVDDPEYKKELEEFSARLSNKAGIKDFCLAYIF